MSLVQINVVVPEPPTLIDRVTDKVLVGQKCLHKVACFYMLAYEQKDRHTASEREENGCQDRRCETVGDPQGELREHDEETEERQSARQIVCK